MRRHVRTLDEYWRLINQFSWSRLPSRRLCINKIQQEIKINSCLSSLVIGLNAPEYLPLIFSLGLGAKTHSKMSAGTKQRFIETRSSGAPEWDESKGCCPVWERCCPVLERCVRASGFVKRPWDAPHRRHQISATTAAFTHTRKVLLFSRYSPDRPCVNNTS